MIKMGKATGRKLGRMGNGSIFCVEGGVYNFRFDTENEFFEVEDEMDQVEATEGEILFGHEMLPSFFVEYFTVNSQECDTCENRCDGLFSQAAEKEKHVGFCMREYRLSECHDCYCRLDCLAMFIKGELYDATQAS
jgi:hypothetical protein